MAPTGSENRNGGSVARGHAAGIRAAEVPTDYEVKARKADRKFSGVESCRTEPTIGLVVGARGGGLSRSAKQFVSDYTEKGSISPERPGCFHGENQAE